MNLPNHLSEIQVNYIPKIKASEMYKISSSKDALECFRHIWSNKVNYIEECFLILLNRANKAMGYVKLSSGGTAGTIVEPKIIFQIALKCNASSMILCHNHPSGNIKPSEQDKIITKQIQDAGKFLGIPLLDHLIITEESYYSFADDGAM